jgi:hypothetical protein
LRRLFVVGVDVEQLVVIVVFFDIRKSISALQAPATLAFGARLARATAGRRAGTATAGQAAMRTLHEGDTLSPSRVDEEPRKRVMATRARLPPCPKEPWQKREDEAVLARNLSKI